MAAFRSDLKPVRSKTDEKETKLSKALSWLLRHGAEREGFKLDDGGFLNVSDILKLKNFRNYTFEDVQHVVTNDKKQRYTLRSCQSELQIRANQGHSIDIPDLELVPITDPDAVPFVIHGTYKSKLEAIERTGLSRMGRNHIHCFDADPSSKQVISGARQNCDVFIYIDLKKAMKDGFLFFRSSNGVILSPGNEFGIIPCIYFEKITHK